MGIVCKLPIGLMSLTGLAGLMMSLAALASDSHCSSQESTVFTCSVGKKIASVCASKDLNKTTGWLQYRFGPKSAPEIQIPQDKTHLGASIKSGNWSFSGGGGAYLRFTNNNNDYLVYTAIGKGWGVKEGVAVEKGGKLVANIKCIKAAQSKLGPELFEQLGVTADDKAFDLP